MSRKLAFRVTIKDCDMETFRVSGAGGQRRDKTETGVRIRHRPSGAVGQATESRRQIDNKRAAFRRMGESEAFQWWARLQVGGIIANLERVVDAALDDTNLQIEVRQNGQWVPA